MPVFGYFIMTFQVPDILTLFAFSVLMIVLLKIVLNHEKASSIPNMPPGPWKLPIIGNIHQLLTSAPHQKLRDLAKIHGPLMRLQLGEVTVIIVSSPKYAKEIMKTHDAIFASRPHSVTSDILSYQSTGIASAPYGNYWNVVRKMCTVELLGKNRVTSFQSLRKEELTNLIKMIDSKKESPVNLTETVLSSIYSIVSRAAFGNKCKDQQEFISLVKEGLAVLGDLFPSGRWLQLVTGFRPKLERLHEKIDRILENIIVEHKETKSDGKEGESAESEDLVDILLKLQDGNDRNQNICLTDNNIKATIQVRGY